MTLTIDRKETEIGMIPQEWKVLKLEEILDGIIDNRGKNPPINTNGHELIETGCMTGDKKYPDYSLVTKYVDQETYNTWFRKGHPKKDNILVATVGANAGDVCIMKESRGCIAQNFIGLQFNSQKAIPEFIYYLLISEEIKNKIKGLDIGSVQPSIKVGHITNVELPVPPLKEQQAIATTLGSLDAKIELLREQNKTLEAIGQTMFKSWFVDFDGVTEFEDSELGQIPKGWKVEKLGGMIDIAGGLAYKSEYLDKGNNILLTMGSVIGNGRFNYNGYKYYSGPYSDKNLLHPGDLIIATRDVTQDRVLIGAVAMVPNNLDCEKIIGGTNVYLVKNLGKVSNNFLYYLFKSQSYRNRIIGASKGTTVIMIVKDDVLNFEFAYPNNESILNNFEGHIVPIIEKIQNNENNILSLTQTRDNLLPRLMSGKVRVI